MLVKTVINFIISLAITLFATVLIVTVFYATTLTLAIAINRFMQKIFKRYDKFETNSR
jgi:hypothetical protein